MIPENLKVEDKRFSDIPMTCMEAFKARLRGEISQQMLERILASVTVAILDEFKPLEYPPRPLSCVAWENKSIQDIQRLGKEQCDRQQRDYEEAKKEWLEHFTWVAGQNYSNLTWLKESEATLNREGKTEDAIKVSNMILEHEKAKIGV